MRPWAAFVVGRGSGNMATAFERTWNNVLYYHATTFQQCTVVLFSHSTRIVLLTEILYIRILEESTEIMSNLTSLFWHFHMVTTVVQDFNLICGRWPRVLFGGGSGKIVCGRWPGMYGFFVRGSGKMYYCLYTYVSTRALKYCMACFTLILHIVHLLLAQYKIRDVAGPQLGEASSDIRTTRSTPHTNRSCGPWHRNDNLITFQCSSGRFFCYWRSLIELGRPLPKKVFLIGQDEDATDVLPMLDGGDEAKTLPGQMAHRWNLFSSNQGSVSFSWLPWLW